MPATRTIDIYQFNELDDSAKETARNWYRDGALDYDWWDCIDYDAKAIGKLMGIEIEKIYFSGFASQGDGACFEGSYCYVKGGLKAVKSYAPQDETLHQIAADLQEVQRRAFYQISANVKQSGHYMHENCTDIDVYDYRDGDYASDDNQDGTKEALRDYMRWIYRRLEAEHDWLMADEQVDETIRANEYEFNVDGSRA